MDYTRSGVLYVGESTEEEMLHVTTDDDEENNVLTSG